MEVPWLVSCYFSQPVLVAYETWESLVSYVEKVLREFGSKYVINFA